MTVIRREHTKNYTTIGNDCFADDNLSAEALGVLCYLISKPHNWRVMPAELANRFKSGRDRIYRILNELSDAGYVVRTRVRDDATKAWKATEYIIRDEKQPRPENPDVADLALEKPRPEKPDAGNRTLQKKDSTKELFEQRTEEQDSSASEVLACPGDWPSDYENQWWKAYPRKHDKKPAMKVLNRIAKAGSTPWEELIAGTRHYADAVAGKEARYIKHPTTFLNAESWKNRYNRNHERPKSFLDAALDFGNGDDDEPTYHNGR